MRTLAAGAVGVLFIPARPDGYRNSGRLAELDDRQQIAARVLEPGGPDTSVGSFDPFLHLGQVRIEAQQTSWDAVVQTWAVARDKRGQPDPLVRMLESACEAIGRDPATIGRSVGIFVEPTEATGSEAIGFGVPVRGSADQVADALRAFTEVGVTQVECMLWPWTIETLEAMRPVVERLDRA